MKLISTYSVKIKDYNHIFKASVNKYREAVDFFIDVIDSHWEDFSGLTTKEATALAEKLTLPTKKRPVVMHNFNERFYKTPCYLRRSAISEAYGKASSYRSNLKNWEASDPRTRGKAPSYPKAGYVYPALYKGNMYDGDIRNYTLGIKVFRNNTWDWISVMLRKSDVDYIKKHCASLKMCTPTLQKRGKEWSLDFPFEEKIKLPKTVVWGQTILAVDLGINNACTCSAMRPDGTVLGRRFLKLPGEYDCLKRKTGHIKRAQRHGSGKMPSLWAAAKGVNDDIAVKTANFIIDTALLYNVDTIVMEHLDLGKKKRGSKKQKLALWRAKYVQAMVEHKAHHNLIHISRVNAWNTSRLAFDGSGRVLRGRESSKTGDNYSLCEFTTGKVYNCDLNATYNIGARYFVREILKSLPVTEEQRIRAKVPGCDKRSTCTLSALISLCGALQSPDCCDAA